MAACPHDTELLKIPTFSTHIGHPSKSKHCLRSYCPQKCCFVFLAFSKKLCLKALFFPTCVVGTFKLISLDLEMQFNAFHFSQVPCSEWFKFVLSTISYPSRFPKVFTIPMQPVCVFPLCASESVITCLFSPV